MHTIDLLLITVSPDYQNLDLVDDRIHVNEAWLIKLYFFYHLFPENI